MNIRRGFTLIELLIVVAIIAILAAIAVPNFLEAQVRAKVSRAKADMRSLATAIESYYIDHNSYPPDGDDRGDFQFDSAARLKGVTTPIAYIIVLPTDPFNDGDQSRIYGPLDPLNAMFPGPPPYTYAYNTKGSFFGDFVDPLDIALPMNPTNNGSPDNWGLTSMGPSRQFDSALFQMPITYDPSNGTVSMGDVIRQGGRIYQ